MNNAPNDLTRYARKLVYINPGTSVDDAVTQMLANDVSMLPILNNQGKKNEGLIKRKTIFNWIMKNPDKSLSGMKVDMFKEKDPLDFVKMETSVEEISRKLKEKSALLVKGQDDVFSHLITPRVVADMLKDYAYRFWLFENIEKAIRKKIIDGGIDPSELGESENNKKFPTDPDYLDFGQYATIFVKRWDSMNMGRISRSKITELLDKARAFRNQLMHFRAIENEEGFAAAEQLWKLLK